MNKTLNFNETLQHLTEIFLSLNRGTFDLDQTQFKARLQLATSNSINSEAGIAWRNRMIIRARLRKYATKQ
jgi:hypothetical protein